MNKIAFLVSIAFMFVYQSIAQINFGPAIGISTVKIANQSFSLKNLGSGDSMTLSYFDSDYGYHFGAFLRYKKGHFYVQPELYFNSNKTTYKLKNLGSVLNPDSLKSERYQNLDLQLILGYQIGIIRLGAGPVAHIFINNKSELTDIEGYEAKFKSATYAMHLLFGFDIGKLAFDLRWENNFTKYGDYINIGGQNYQFSKRPTKVIATLGYLF